VGLGNEERIMNARVALISVREKLEQLIEGLICVAASAIVLVGTVAICFPTVA
jgi:hypothetical protein